MDLKIWSKNRIEHINFAQVYSFGKLNYVLSIIIS